MEIIACRHSARAQVAAAYREYAAALARHDAAALAAHYDDDAVILAPGAKPIAGAAAVRAYCEGICALPYDFDVRGFTIEHVLVAGDYVIEVSCFTSTSCPMRDPDARAATILKALMVWRNRGGRWLIVRDMYSDIRT
jgi:uncharacterized protein (TIGR02246 family)